MKLIADVVDDFVNDLARRLDGGSLELYDGTPPVSAVSGMSTFRTPLVTFQFRTPAFDPSMNGIARMLPIDRQVILQSGGVTWARLLTASDQPISILTVAQQGTEEARQADLVFKRLDFSQGGFCELEDFALKLPSVG